MKTSQRLIIKFKKDVPEEKRKEIISQYGLRLVKVIEDLNMYVVEVPERASQEELMKKLSERKEVEYVEPDRIYRIWLAGVQRTLQPFRPCGGNGYMP